MHANGLQIDLNQPLVMAIMNVTPDSFFAQSRLSGVEQVLQQAQLLLNQGATILDLGAYSSRPGAIHISEQEELDRLIPAVEALAKSYPLTPISVDTFRANVAQQAVKAGAHIINDISGGSLDHNMFKMVAKLGVPYILMHMKGTPQNMQLQPSYENVTLAVADYFKEKLAQLKNTGVENIILDPGFGFAKTIEHNYQLLREMESLHQFGLPILVGVSRKSMITKALDVDTEQALNGTTILNTIALQKGAKILRVHDVIEAKQCIELVKRLNG